VTRVVDLLERLRRADLVKTRGRVTRSVGQLVEASGPPAFVGEICRIHMGRHDAPLHAEVVGFAESRILLMPWASNAGVRPGAEVEGSGEALSIRVGDDLLGRVVNGRGVPIDGKGIVDAGEMRAVRGPRLGALDRVPDREPLATGVRGIDAFVSCALGQRLGIFAGGGVGKSVLLGMIARSSSADVNVLALVGERGREVVDFLHHELGADGLARSVVVVATSDESAIQRVQAARVACAIAESFRDRGRKVLFLLDSLTRVAMAQREIGLGAGEPPTTRGYPPSSFAILPEIIERAGRTRTGSITGFYTILLEGDDIDAPVSDAARAVLDGHLVLSRELATRSQFPAVDVLDSVSRLRDDCQDPEMNTACRAILEVLGARRAMHDLIAIGAYKKGSDARVDRALGIEDEVRRFLCQGRRERSGWEETRAGLLRLASLGMESARVPA
jgi:FliI/YscN family ATPase